MPVIANASAALDLLCNHLQARFDADFAGDFAEFGGVRVLKEEQEPDPENEDADDVGSPYIALWIDSDDDAPDWGTGARRLVVGVKCVATEFTGAIGGDGVASNPVASDVRMSENLYQIVKEGFLPLTNSGLADMNIRKRRPRRSEEQIVYVKPHDITCYYFTE